MDKLYKASTTKKATALTGVTAAIISAILAVEGGFVDHQDDPGGATNWGITEQVARQHGYAGDMKNLSQDLAGSIYYADYIEKPGYVPFLELAPAVAEELVDTAVNTGPDHSSRWLQISLNALSQGGKAYPTLVVDGQVGAKTAQAYAALQKLRGKAMACRLVVKSLDAQQGQYYLSISISNPKLQSFTSGWIANRVGNVPLSHCD